MNTLLLVVSDAAWTREDSWVGRLLSRGSAKLWFMGQGAVFHGSEAAF